MREILVKLDVQWSLPGPLHHQPKDSNILTRHSTKDAANKLASHIVAEFSIEKFEDFLSDKSVTCMDHVDNTRMCRVASRRFKANQIKVRIIF